MTTTDLRDAAVDDEPIVRLGEAGRLGPGIPEQPAAPDQENAGTDDERPFNPMTAVAVAFLSTAGVGWMLGGIFTGTTGRLVGVGGALIGTGVVALAERWRWGGLSQLLALPVAVLAGIGLATSSAGGTNPFRLVSQAIRAGGLTQPPVPFDPGWRFLLVVLTCTIAVTAAATAVQFRRARLAAIIPAPVMAAGTLLQPNNHELVSITVSVLLAIGSFAVAYGSELAADSHTGGAFEARRLLKAVGLLVGILALVVGMSHLSFLYPPQKVAVVIPPKRPQTPPAVNPNQLLFTVKAPTSQPLRTGELDVYDADAWLTPPYDTGRLVDVTAANLPAFAAGRVTVPTPGPTPKKTTQVTVTIDDLGEARQIPDLADAVSVKTPPSGLQYDPRAQTLQTPGRPGHGLTYTVVAAAPADSTVLKKAPAPGPALAPFLAVPPPPIAVTDLLSKVPQGLDRYDRLQYVRNYYYKHAVGSGPGNPVDVTPTRVAQILQGKPASPYEIVAGEALLARWAGVPARIGYGYYYQGAIKNGTYQVHPSDGAMWLEAYFAGSGWVPIIGHPKQATSSLNHPNHTNPQILPNGQLIAQIYVPLEQTSLRMLYTLVQYWLLHGALPIAGIVLFLWLLLPGLVKMARRLRRRVWAGRIGPGSRIATAYSEFRDRAIDFNIGHPTLTPLEFLDVTLPDDEHKQLAWLVTRALWGDLRRDQRDEDAEAAEDLAASLTRRLSAGQPALLRVAAFASRESLRAPYCDEIPNLWLRHRLRLMSRLRAAITALRRGVRRPRDLRRRLAKVSVGSAPLIVVLLMVGMLSGCGAATRAPAQAAPLPSVPATVGAYQLQLKPSAQDVFNQYRAKALISSLALYGIRSKGVTVGTLQTASLKPGLKWQNSTVRKAVITSLGGTPTLHIVNGVSIYEVTINQVQLFAHFMPSGRTYELLGAGPDFNNPESFFTQTLAVQEGQPGIAAVAPGPTTDPRRGWQ
ncbi:MAG TPA: transglutaminase domain-containing protein [Mycobacteriales bacterium]|nr:transglutaminase domain-containing protein [Mycobacteriales bacterium]